MEVAKEELAPEAARRQQQQQASFAEEPAEVDAAAAADEDEDEEEAAQAECTTEHGHESSEIKSALSKCALCDKAFQPEDCPKLLECLHAACSGCVNSKLAGHQDTSVDADILRE